MFLDISVRDFTGHFTAKAKPFGVTTQILLKVPTEALTTIRLIAPSNFEITEFLRSLTVLDMDWTEQKVHMHVNAIKHLTEANAAPAWKNRALMEARRAA
jgi:hypothetical protein